MTVLAEQMLDGEAETIVRKVIALAKRGDAIALRLCFERIFPARKGRPVAITLPEVKTPGDAAAALAVITAAVGRGEISSDEALQLSTVIEVAHRTIEAIEHESRLALIEERLGLRNGQ